MSVTLITTGVSVPVTPLTGPLGAAAVQTSAESARGGAPGTGTARRASPTVTAILFNSLSGDARPLACRAAAELVNTLNSSNEYAGASTTRRGKPAWSLMARS